MDNGVAFVTGRLTRDPQFFGEGEKRRAVFSIAFNRGKEENRKTTFLDCIAWGKRADIMESFKQGGGIHVSGELETDSWEKDGKKHSKIRLNINTITATTSNRPRSEENTEGGEDTAEVPASKNAKRGKATPQTADTGDLPF
jgi:single stranded DNA-binding protein